MTYQQTWDMEKIFKGGSDSKELEHFLNQQQQMLTELKNAVQAWDHQSKTALVDIIATYEQLEQNLSEAQVFLSGLYSADTSDQTAAKKLNDMAVLYSKLGNIGTSLQKAISAMDGEAFKQLFTHDFLAARQFPLTEMRNLSQKLLSAPEEKLINALSIDGFYAWEDMSSDLVSSLEFPFEVNGEIQKLSAGQAENNMHAAPTVEERKEKLAIWEHTWQDAAPLFSRVLNHLAGFRLTNYDAHDRKDYMERPLEYNRMKAATLDTMWNTISKNKQPLVEFFNRKAQLLGVDQLNWLDVDAAVEVGDFENKTYTFDEAADFIVKHFRSFSPKMAQMAQTAFEDRWIEAEDRPGKRPGGYCADLPLAEESRIFMTFSGSADNVATLAHELGHAFHSHVMRDMPVMNRNYAMNVAETASTFAEQIINDATIKSSASEAEKINLLNNKIIQGVAMKMNIHARYIFERHFYDERQKGMVSADRLSELMLEAQKEAYENALGSYHPMFWAAKLHFYITGVPFYNFPYTFGYFFSQGIYAKGLAHGDNFEDKYIALLRDTASMTTEELAKKHLDVDLTQPDFWQHAIDLVHDDIKEFLSLTEKYV